MPRKTLILIVAYNAEAHIEGLLGRVPPQLFKNPSVAFLCIDDASSDRTAEIASRWVDRNGVKRFSVLRNPRNQGYGGNQKLGYRYALDAGFDHTILLHGDGQYAPEMLPEIIERMSQGVVEVVLCTRMRSWKEARKGGMPLYKIAGNWLLTRLQNALTRRHLSEYHTGYRAYSTRFLKRVPFELNTNDFHFDTEILLQAFLVKAEISELSIRAHYGDEVCHVNGVKYAWNVIRSTLEYCCQRLGLFCSLKYRRLDVPPYSDKTLIEGSTHAVALRLLAQAKARNVLDLGCSAGHMAERCRTMGMAVTGIDVAPPPARMKDFHRMDLEHSLLPVDPGAFDAVLMCDVLEHLSGPERFLLAFRHRIGSDSEMPLLILSTPNVAFITIRLGLLLGRFNYGERGILDMTHRRLFTLGSFKRMLVDTGYVIERSRPIGVPFELAFPGWMGRWLGRFSSLLARLWPQGFAFQFLVVCRPVPSVGRILQNSARIRRIGSRVKIAR